MNNKTIATIKIPVAIVDCLSDAWMKTDNRNTQILSMVDNGVSTILVEYEYAFAVDKVEDKREEPMEVHVSVFWQLNRDVCALAKVLAERECGSHRRTLQDIINRRARSKAE